MHVCPFRDEAEDSWRQMAAPNFKRINSYDGAVVSIPRNRQISGMALFLESDDIAPEVKRSQRQNRR